jgi:DNA-3-methyladenine glycosylase I
MAYHDEEWGLPVADDQKLFEKLCLEGFQAGLSWRTILEKREAFRLAFEGFHIDRVAAFSEEKVAELLQNAGIVRHRGKIEAVVGNARRARELREREGSLGAFLWRYAVDPEIHRSRELQTVSPESVALSKDLRKLGWSFVGPTTLYSFMQAMGLVNDHHRDCRAFACCDKAREAFSLPR